MITNDAIKFIVQQLSLLNYQIAIGTGTTPPWVDNKTLEEEYARADATTSVETTAVEGDTLKIEATFDITERVTISEYGVFHKDTGLLIARQVHDPMELPVGTALKVIFHIQAVRV